jgi:hypothetical protein
LVGPKSTRAINRITSKWRGWRRSSSIIQFYHIARRPQPKWLKERPIPGNVFLYAYRTIVFGSAPGNPCNRRSVSLRPIRRPTRSPAMNQMAGNPRDIVPTIRITSKCRG